MRAITIARKPLLGSVTQNVIEHGCSALNVDGCRIGYAGAVDQMSAKPGGRATGKAGALAGKTQQPDRPRKDFQADNTKGRWPANVILQGCVVVANLDAQGEAMGIHSAGSAREAIRQAGKRGLFPMDGDGHRFGDSGGASRFFKQVK